MVFAVAHNGVGLVDGNVVRADVKDHPDGALVLGTGRQRSGVGRERPFTPARTPPVTTTGPALLHLTALQHTSPSRVFTGPFHLPKEAGLAPPPYASEGATEAQRGCRSHCGVQSMDLEHVN